MNIFIVLKVNESYEKPSIKSPNDILIKVATSAINPVDWKIRKIRVPGQPKPFIPGADFAGIVEDAPPESKFKNGDKVYGMLPILSTPGSSAEYVVAKEEHISLAPNNLSLTESAAIPLVSLTVLQAFDKIGITEASASEIKGRKILIHAGAGGVGMYHYSWSALIFF